MSIDSHQFYLSTISFQNEAESSACGQAKALQNLGLTTAKADRLSRKICEKSYKTFEMKIFEKFPSESFKDLISLTLKSRTNFFFVELKGRVKELILSKNTENLKEM